MAEVYEKPEVIVATIASESLMATCQSLVVNNPVASLPSMCYGNASGCHTTKCQDLVYSK